MNEIHFLVKTDWHDRIDCEKIRSDIIKPSSICFAECCRNFFTQSPLFVAPTVALLGVCWGQKPSTTVILIRLASRLLLNRHDSISPYLAMKKARCQFPTMSLNNRADRI
jgi:hypothetical protein